MQRKLSVRADPATLPEVRAFVDDAATLAGFDERTRYQITMAANEAVSNAIEHGRPCTGGRVLLSAAASGDELTLAVRDCGNFVDAGSLRADPIAERGRGFAFMNLLMDDVRLDARPGQTVVRLAKRLPGAAEPPAPAPDAESEAGNVELVRRLLEALERRDAAALMQIADRGIVFEPLSTEVQQRTPYLGRPGLRRYLQDLEDTWDELRVAMHEFASRDDYVVALGRIRGVRGPHVAEGTAGMVWRVRDGMAVWGKVYSTENEALRAAGLPDVDGAAA